MVAVKVGDIWRIDALKFCGFEYMKISVENLGILKQAEFELGDLTIICGTNNTGKTYATYSLFGFLVHQSRLLKFEITDSQTNTLLTEGVLHIDVTSYTEKVNSILKNGCQRYSAELSKIFASKPAYFRNTSFQVELPPNATSRVAERTFNRVLGLNDTKLLTFTKAAEDKNLVISLLLESGVAKLPPTHITKDIISNALNEIIFGSIFPKPFIASAERTGAAIFRKELNFARNRLLEEMAGADKDFDPMELLFKSYQDYALPVKFNADYIRNLESISKQDSFLAENHPEVLDKFSDIIGGEYIAGNNDTISFKPSQQQKLKLTMGESSSAVRSLLDVGFYLRHSVKPGDLLMVDEPGLNLHPENQRRIARLFARLVNLGIKVFITTHSDYVVKELNTLIMLNQDKPYLRQISEREGYQLEETISAEKIKVYIAKKALIKLKNKQRRSECQTLEAANVDSKFGIEVRSFDETINKMNEIQDAILWGGDE